MSKPTSTILKMLKTRKDCPTAEKIYMEIKHDMPDVSLRRVETILQHLCEQGLIIKIKSRSGGPERYDASGLPKIVFECQKCGMIEDIYLYDIQLRRLYSEMKKIGEEIGANANHSEINLSGLCEKCRKKEMKNEEANGKNI